MTLIDFNPECRVTFMNQINKTLTWSQWKLVKDCSQAELDKVNLMSLPENYILLDRDFGKEPVDKQIIIDDYTLVKKQLLDLGIENFLADNSRNGYHVFIPTDNLGTISDSEVRNKVRELYIEKFNCDMAKKSVIGVISIPNRPHFKTMKNCGIIEKHIGANYIIPSGKLSVAKDLVEKNKTYNKAQLLDADFENYFETDPFFKYLSNNIIKDGTSRWNTILPNLAIACVKSGKTDVEIKKIIIPILHNNLPGKSYAEFNGWLKKAKTGIIDTYNFYQLNNWIEKYTKLQPLYNTKILLTKTEDVIFSEKCDSLEEKQTKNKFKFYKDSELDDLDYTHTEWLIEDWLPKGDINFLVGKSASFKTTLSLHIAFAIASGKLVFNKYKTIKSKVLYLNEENASNIFINMRDRVKAGLGIEGVEDNVHVTILSGIRLDKVDNVLEIIKYVQENNIGVVVCDSFRRFIGFDENNATEMNNLFNIFKYFRNECPGLTIVNLHHLKKFDPTKNLDMRDMLRGSSDITNNADSIIGIKRKVGFDQIICQHIKNRSGPEKQPVLINLDTEENFKTYIYESDKSIDIHNSIDSEVNKCATDILAWLDISGKTEFKAADADADLFQYTLRTVQRALKELCGGELPSLTTEGKNRGLKYIKIKKEVTKE